MAAPITGKQEFEDCRILAEKTGLPLGSRPADGGFFPHLPMTTTPQTPFERLRAVLLPRKRIAVALSRGAGQQRVACRRRPYPGSGSLPGTDCANALRDGGGSAGQHGVVPPPGRPAGKTGVSILPALANNPPLRCYLCKHALFSSLAARAAEMGFPLLADGSNP